MIGGTGAEGPHVARALHERGRAVTLFHRGQHESVLLSGIRHSRSPEAALPVLSFPAELLRTEFEIVIHMIPMGEADARIAAHTLAGRVQRLVALSSGDVYQAYGRFTGLEPGPVKRAC